MCPGAPLYQYTVMHSRKYGQFVPSSGITPILSKCCSPENKGYITFNGEYLLSSSLTLGQDST